MTKKKDAEKAAKVEEVEKIPVETQTLQWTGKMDCLLEMKKFLGSRLMGGIIKERDFNVDLYGGKNATVRVGDWVVKEGLDISVHKPDKYKALYK